MDNLAAKTASLLRECAATLEKRSDEYNGTSDMFGMAAIIARELDNNTAYTPHNVFIILRAVKLARLTFNPKHRDSLVDLLGYTALQIVSEHGGDI